MENSNNTATQSTDNTTNEITIYLQESSNTRAFEDKNRVHEEQFQKVTGWIDKAINRKTDQYERLQETISIFGSRGSGKTSFLLSLIKNYTGNPDSKVTVINIIDPTLIEQKGHIFLTIISQIKSKVDNKLKSCECNPNDSTFCLKQIWDEKLKALAHGLPSIDGVGQPKEDSWQDPEYIMQKGLRAVLSAKELEKHFHEFVEMSLKILEKDIFLLMLDDIDVDFRKGWPVLESLRKYLTTPQIITLISGDYGLFIKAVRKQQWKNFGKELLINEGQYLGKINEYNDLVTEMESQYLQKVLKSQRRVWLNTIGEKLENKLPIYVCKESKETPIAIKQYYINQLKKFGIKSASEAEPYLSFMLNLPLRTQIQFLSLLIDNEKDAATAPFLNNLYDKQVEIELATSLPSMINIIILKLLLSDDCLQESYQLHPNTANESFNGSLAALAFLFSQEVKSHPHLIFDYFIRIGYMRNICRLMSNASKLDLSPSIEGLRKYANLYIDKYLHDISGNISAYMRGYLNNKSDDAESLKPFAGTVILKGLNRYAKGKEPEGRIDYIFGNDFDFESTLAYIPLSLSAYNHKNASLTTYSIFNLLATIGDIVREKNLSADATKEEKDREINNIEKILQRVHQFWEYKIPDFGDSQTNEENGEGDDENGTPTGTAISELAQLIIEWIDRYPKEPFIPYFLGKLLSRFYHALDNIEGVDNINNVGESMHRRLCALMNAILIEDVRESIADVININLNNVFNSDRYFIDNLTKVNKLQNDKKEKLSFSRWMLSCPLFLLYLNPLLINELKTFIDTSFGKNDKKTDDILKCSIYPKLTLVDIRGKRHEKKENIQMNPEVSVDKSDNTNLPQASQPTSKKPSTTRFGVKYFNKVLPILQKSVDYHKFMNGNLKEVHKICRPHFIGMIKASSITKIRKEINSDPKKYAW